MTPTFDHDCRCCQMSSWCLVVPPPLRTMLLALCGGCGKLFVIKSVGHDAHGTRCHLDCGIQVKHLGQRCWRALRLVRELAYRVAANGQDEHREWHAKVHCPSCESRCMTCCRFDIERAAWTPL